MLFTDRLPHANCDSANLVYSGIMQEAIHTDHELATRVDTVTGEKLTTQNIQGKIRRIQTAAAMLVECVASCMTCNVYQEGSCEGKATIAYVGSTMLRDPLLVHIGAQDL